MRALTVGAGRDVDRLRLRWYEGRIALNLGRPDLAEAILREAQQGFLDRRMGYDAALVILELAILYAQQGAMAELKRLAAEVVPAFESRDVQRETFAALLMFQHACETETATVRLLRHLATMLETLRRRPTTVE